MMLTGVFAMAQEIVRVHVGEESYVTTIDNVTFDVEDSEVPVLVTNLQDSIEKLSSKVDMMSTFFNLLPTEFVDLGLPSGILWAKSNLGSSVPSDAGFYFRWNNGKGQYNREKPADVSEIETIMLSEDDDIVTQMLGKQYRMPSEAEFNELLNNCAREVVYNYENTGVGGIIFYKKSNDPEHQYTTEDVHVFFPVTGYKNTSPRYFGKLADTTAGHYWTRNFAWDCEWNDGYELAYELNFFDGATYLRALTHHFCVIRAICYPEGE